MCRPVTSIWQDIFIELYTVTRKYTAMHSNLLFDCHEIILISINMPTKHHQRIWVYILSTIHEYTT